MIVLQIWIKICFHRLRWNTNDCEWCAHVKQPCPYMLCCIYECMFVCEKGLFTCVTIIFAMRSDAMWIWMSESTTYRRKDFSCCIYPCQDAYDFECPPFGHKVERLGMWVWISRPEEHLLCPGKPSLPRFPQHCGDLHLQLLIRIRDILLPS